MKHALLLISVGPVQDFIASARRCQDFWYGSELLSRLAKAAAQSLADAFKCEDIVFPGGLKREWLNANSDHRISVANKLLVRVPGGLAVAKTAGEAAEEAIRHALRERRDSAVEDIRSGMKSAGIDDDAFNEETARTQLDDLLEIMWVAVDEGASYDDARREAERLLGARKNTKAWTQPTWPRTTNRAADGADVSWPKSALDGARESVLDEALFSKAATEGGEATRAENLYEAFRVHGTERLCGVGLLKRVGVLHRPYENEPDSEDADRFLSTSHVAALPFMLRGCDADAFEKYRKTLIALVSKPGEDHRAARKRLYHRVLGVSPMKTDGFGRADGSILFEGRLATIAEELGVDTGSQAGKHKLNAAREALNAFLAACGATPRLPIPYYAILLADGDRMGAAIDATAQHDQHAALSRALMEFANEVTTVVENTFDGTRIYSGGDDVLAFLPLHQALACADELRRKFRDRLRGFAPSAGPPPTLSTGLAIVHHIEPMEIGIKLARRAEALAKAEPKNRLAIVRAKRSATPVEISGSWDAAGGVAPLHKRLEAWTRMHREDVLPDGAAFELEKLEGLYADPRDDKEGRNSSRLSLASLLNYETERILSRKRPRKGERPELDAQVYDRLTEFGLDDPVRLAHELIVARLLASVASQAGLPVSKEGAA